MADNVSPQDVVYQLNVMRRVVGSLIVAAVLAAVLYLAGLTWRIVHQARIDEARPVDVIVVFGAAEYHGRPSPVLRARLDHALTLYRKGLAPRILTTGGSGGDPVFTESEVGRSYLAQKGVPVESIIVEPQGESTAQSASATAEILKRMNLRTIVVVTDDYHVFRAKKILEGYGFEVYGSPRPSRERGDTQQIWLCFRQAVGYALWSVGVRI